jgi:octaprenyl-diphosphate synthase
MSMKSSDSSTLSSWLEILELVRSELEQVEKRFRAELVSPVPAVTSIGQYLQVSGGKRLRPTLLLLAARAFGPINPSAVALGTVVEMIHTATLVHDDVIDGANLRRGRPSTNSRWGNHASVLAGDWLYMQAFNLAVRERNFHVLDILIQLTQKMVEGELLQWAMIGRIDVTEAEHLDLVDRKTACLFGACTRLGAVASGQDTQIEEAMERFGRNLGMAFQLADDLLDFTASEDVLGKPVGSDLREGKITLPLIHLLDRCTAAEQALVAKVMEERGFRSVAWEDLLGLISRYQTPQRVKQQAMAYATDALACLDALPDSPYKKSLAVLPDLVVNRQN